MKSVSNTSTIVLQTNELTIGYSGELGTEKYLHQNINLQIARGEFICLLGPNGAGKTTLIKTLAGLIKPICGTIKLNHLPIQSLSIQRIAKLISIVFTERLNLTDMTVYDLVALGRSPHTGFFGRLSTLDHEKVAQAINDCGITHLKNRSLNQLSDGEQQKGFIAKALSQDTPIIILDEPTAFLDISSRIELMRLLKKLSIEKNKAILLSTHDLDLALRSADRLWLLAREQTLITGIPEDLILSNKFKNFFDKDGILFDNQTGAFSEHLTNLKTIRLIGNGLEFKWVQRALKRSGYQPTPDKGEFMEIEVSNETHGIYHVSHPNGSLTSLRTIEDLLSHLSVSADGIT